MEKVVVGVGDGPGQPAVEWVIRRSARRVIRVTLVRAFDPVTADPLDEQRILQQAGEEIVRRSPNTAVDLVLETVSIPAALLAAAEDADLLVVGSHHRHPLRSLLTGAVPLELAARSTCATVIVPDDWTPSDQRTVVVGVAADGTSDRATLFAAHEAQLAGADLDAVHAWTVAVPTLAGPDLVVDEATQRVDHRELLSRALDRIRAAYPRVRVRGLLEQRPTSDALSERSGHGQLLVLGSHRWGPVAGLVLGSAARDALRTASAPLCIVPPGAPARQTTRTEHEQVARAE